MHDIYPVLTMKSINGKEYTQIDGLSVRVFYNVHEIESSKKYRNFVCHSILENILKVPNFWEYFHSQEVAIKELRKMYPDANAENSKFFVIHELQAGVKFRPDIRMFNETIEYKKQMEEKYNIKYGGEVAIINTTESNSYKLLYPLVKIYGRFANYSMATNMSEAYSAIHNFKNE